jgi:hypothetical protein
MYRSIVSDSTPNGCMDARRNAPSGDFDEHQFCPLSQHRAAYYAEVARGYRQMSSGRVVIAGLARDIADVLPQTLERIERLGGLFNDYRVVIYENDSADGTRETLHRWSRRNPRACVVCEDRADPINQPSRCLSRAARMAYYRSRCQQIIAQEYSRFDHVILVDTDLHGGWSYEGVAHTFGQREWDFVGANGIIYRRQGLNPNAIVHYDAWAFRLDADFTPLSTKQVNHMLYRRGEPLTAVYSCFGGLGIYRMSAYLSGKYDGSDVEHVTFHREMHRRGFRNTYLNPNLITVYGRKHRSWDPLAARIIRAMDKLPRRSSTIWHYSEPTRAAATDVPPNRTRRAA